MMKTIFMALGCMMLFVSCGKETKNYEPQSFDDLAGHKVCLMEGSVQQDYAMSHLKDKGIDFVYFPSTTDCMLALNQGKADVFFAASLYAYNEAFHRQNLKICHEVDEIKGKIAFGLKKDNTALIADMNAFQDSLTRVGVKDEIVNRWFDTDNTDFHNCVKIPPTDGKPSGKRKVLRVGICGATPPEEILLDNKWTGCEIELLQRYAAARGYDLAIETYTFNNLIPGLQSGKVDVVAAILTINEERKEKIAFLEPYTELKAAFIVPDKSKTNISFWQKLKNSAYYSIVAENRWMLIVNGLWITLIISISALLLGMILGGAVCWLRMNRRPWLRNIGKAYVNIMRNMPILVFLMLMFYVFLAGTGLPTIVVAIIAFGMNSAAYICEIYRTGIESVERGQTEAGLALGFTPLQTFIYIVAPQAIHKAMPVFKNEAVTLLKGTSIVGYISIVDLTKASDLIRSASFEAFFPLFIVSLIYFFLAWLFTAVLSYVEKKI